MEFQWWQWLGGLITLLGLSPAPWLVAVLTGRLLTLGAHLRRVGDIQSAHKLEMDHQTAMHARELAAKDVEIARLTADRADERTATRVERDRADAMAAKLAALTEQFGQITVGILTGGGDRARRKDASDEPAYT